MQKQTMADGKTSLTVGEKLELQRQQHQHVFVLERGQEFDEEGHLSGEWAEEVCADCGYRENSGGID